MATLDPKERRIKKLEEILGVAKAMSTERDLGVLLEEIVEHARSVVEATRGSIFLLDKDKNELWSKVAQGAREIRFPADKGIAGHVAQTKKPLNIPDAYADPRFNPAVDKATGFHTRNMLTVPMLSTKEEVVGVLQVLNKNPGDHAAEVEKGSPGPPFDAEDEEMLLALGGQAASAIENAILYDEINKLFEGFIAASVVAIESRDPTTSGHSGRVATLTCGLAEVIDRVETGPFASTTFDYDQMKEIRYASLLHDFGKVGVREDVLVKAKKLPALRLELIRLRAEILKRGLELRYAKQKLGRLLRGARDGFEAQAAMWDLELAALLGEIDTHLSTVGAANEPTVMPADAAAGLHSIAIRAFVDHLGESHTVITPEEAEILSIPRGSLTLEEFRQIQSHVLHTFEFLKRIPWTKELRHIPEIASSHHEKLNGSGYPEGRRGVQIPLQSRMMTVSDIFDALTASDRPYKTAVPVERALDILDQERKAGALDSDVFNLFIDLKPWEAASRS